MFFEFEKKILDKLDSWNPVTVARSEIQLASYGDGDPPEKCLRLLVGFLYNTESDGDRASIGETYLERIPCSVVMDLYKGQAIDRKQFLDLFNELQTYACNEFSDVRQFDVFSGYVEQTQEAFLTLTALINLDKEVSK